MLPRIWRDGPRAPRGPRTQSCAASLILRPRGRLSVLLGPVLKRLLQARVEVVRALEVDGRRRARVGGPYLRLVALLYESLGVCDAGGCSAWAAEEQQFEKSEHLVLRVPV